MRRTPSIVSRKCLALLLLCVVAVARAPAQPVQGDVRVVGFEANTASRFLVRPGQWFPMLVELTAQGQVFQGELRATFTDLDGDRISYVERPVAVTPGSPRRVWCYAVAHNRDVQYEHTLDVVSEAGNLIARIDVPLFDTIDSDRRVFLDISRSAVSAIASLDAGADSSVGRTRSTPYYRPIRVARLRSSDLPDRWIGLEMAETIIWDEPDPDAVSDAQLESLIEWVRNGGDLVVGIGASWPKLQKSKLAAILPLTGEGRVVSVTKLGGFTDDSRVTFTSREEFRDPVAVAVVDASRDAETVRRCRLPGNSPVALIAMRAEGSGRVLASAVRLSDLFSIAKREALLQEVVDLNPRTDKYNEAEGQAMYLDPKSLYPAIIKVVGFGGQASALVLAAFAFVFLYILVSTFGIWGWLKRYSLSHHSWPAFATFAVVVSIVSLAAVGLLRGVSGNVHTMSFVDLDAGSAEARAKVYVGYKSPRRQRADLSLDGDDGFIRPAAGRMTDAEYATPERYSAIVGQAHLVDTPMRATLKQFEGVWHGLMDGRITGQLTASRVTGQITDDSWLRNELGTAVVDGYLLYIDPRLRAGPDGAVPPRASGLTQRTDREKYWDSEVVPSAVNVLAVSLGEIPIDARVAKIGDIEYQHYVQAFAQWSQRGPDAPRKAEPMLPTLWQRQNETWSRAFSLGVSFADDTLMAGLLASTRKLYLANGFNAASQNFDALGTMISTNGLFDLDVTHWLAGGSNEGVAVLLLYTDKPGPARLVQGGDPLSVRDGKTLYRVRIPIKYQGRPPTASP